MSAALADTVTMLAVGVGLVLLAAYASAVESSFARVTRGRATDLRQAGRRGADRLERLLQDTPAAVNTATFVRVGLETAAVAAFVVALTRLVPDWAAVVLGGTVVAAVIFALVGAAGRTVGQQHPDGVALSGAGLVSRTQLVAGPVVRGLVALANGVVPGKGLASGPFATEAELLEFVERAEADAVIEPGESLMLQRVVHLGDTVAREVMVPRPDMVTLDAGTDLPTALGLHLRSGFSRVPVVGRTSDDVVGVSYVKDVAARLHENPPSPDGPTVVADDVMRAAVFVPESKPADDLLREMQAGSVHLAVVIDEYGGVAGLVTIEDLLEEIVGQISDEYDDEEPETEVLGEDRWRLSARTHLMALSEITDRDVEDDDVDTVAGLLTKHLGRVPIRGSSVEVDGLRITADRRGRRNRLLTVVVDRLPEPEPEEEREERRERAREEREERRDRAREDRDERRDERQSVRASAGSGEDERSGDR
ncbi:hemolysin family protein [Aquipuribacter nitratireducens]|uniref:Hemolysin family protein n=1 Tax=Aquipuribacter nitratireducens TaxID=650104 RepID=A0ABW0GJQ6_9MICO